MTPRFLLVLASLASLTLMLLVNVSGVSLLWSSVQNAGHFVLFTTLTLFFLFQLRVRLEQPGTSGRTVLQVHVITIIVLLLLGAMVELIQTFQPQRDASWSDLILDSLGVLNGYMIYALMRHHNDITKFTVCIATLATLAITLLALKPTLQIVAYHLLKSGTPAIVSFKDPFVQTTISVTGHANASIVTTSINSDEPPRQVLRMDLANEDFSGVIFHDTAKVWHDEKNLSFTLHNPDRQSRTLELRIHDIYHNNEYNDRYNRTLTVLPGSNNYLLPVEAIRLARKPNGKKDQLDMQNISEIQLFSTNQQAFTLLLTDLYVQ